MRFLLVATLFAVAFAAQDTKDALVKDADRLKTLANGEIAKLAAEGKTFLAKELQLLETEILAVEKKLESLNPTTELGKIGVHALESVLKSLETKMENEIKKLSAGAFYDNTKDTLIADASKLKTLANGEIAKLAAEGKTFLAKELQLLETEILAVEKKLESLNPTTELGRIGVHALESVLKSLETKMENEIKKLSAGSFYASTKESLIADASKLQKLAEAEIKKLEASGKNLLAKEIQVLEKEILTVEKQLSSINPSNEAGKIAVNALSTVLKGIENKLEAEIKKLGA